MYDEPILDSPKVSSPLSTDKASQSLAIEHDAFISPELLTIIITTSPTPSAPFTELVESVLNSLPVQLQNLPLLISFDGYTLSQSITRLDGRLKRGQIPQSLANVYPDYITNVKRLFGPDVPIESLDTRMHTHLSSTHTDHREVTFIRHKYRQGFALSVKSALYYCTTPNILVLQHDWVFTPSPIPITSLLEILHNEEEVKYISFVARQSRRYEHAKGSYNLRYRAVFKASRALRHGRPIQDDLVACLHFFDRPHLCKVSNYEKLFSSGLVKRGDFIEDTVGTEYLRSISNSSTDEDAVRAWKEYGAWLYHPGDGDQVAIRHTSGRTCLAKEGQEARIKEYIRANQARLVVDI